MPCNSTIFVPGTATVTGTPSVAASLHSTGICCIPDSTGRRRRPVPPRRFANAGCLPRPPAKALWDIVLSESGEGRAEAGWRGLRWCHGLARKMRNALPDRLQYPTEAGIQIADSGRDHLCRGIMSSASPLALIVSAHEWLGRSFESVLSTNGYVVLRAFSTSQAVQHASAAVPDVVFIGNELDDPMSGTDLCRALQADLLISPDTPIVLISARPITRPERLEALRAGVWEILTLPLDAEELLVRLGTYLKARIEANRLREESLIDPDIGLYNVRGILRRVRELGAAASRSHSALACTVFGPDARTPLAAELVARCFGDTCRGSDIVGRLGPHEFVILSPGTDQAGALALARRLLSVAERAESGRIALWAGLFAVPDFASAGIQPVELLVRATTAFRRSRADGSVLRSAASTFTPSVSAGDRIRVFGPRDEVPAH